MSRRLRRHVALRTLHKIVARRLNPYPNCQVFAVRVAPWRTTTAFELVVRRTDRAFLHALIHHTRPGVAPR